ncbi:MAG: NADPH-dependent assimilatory sulfite reductase hemoprotein subunit [Vulcanimicrobiaceae bacterium]
MDDQNLLALGPGNGSKIEAIKSASRNLRGPIGDELANGASHFSEPAVQLLKFHGTYQQENRDARAARKSTGQEKAYQFMVRSRIPGGVLTADQYLVHDDLAQRFGNGTVRLTTRQGIQLHGVLKGELRNTIHAINDALLSTLAACGDVNRNVMGCPAPLRDREHAGVSATAEAIANRLAPRSHAYHELWLDGERLPAEAPETEPIYGPTYLPRKFKIGIAYPGDNCIDVYTQDIGLVPELAGDRLTGFTLIVGGGMGMTHNKPQTYPRAGTPLGFVTADRAQAAVEAIVTVQRDYGDRSDRKHARMKYLIEERGIAWFRAEVELRLGWALDEPHPVAFSELNDHLGWHEQADGNWFLGIFVQNGRVRDDGPARVRSGLNHVIRRFGPGVRITGQQNILLTDILAADRAAVEASLREHGIVADPNELGVRRYSMACPAAPTCGLAVAESERALPTVMDRLEAELERLGLADERLSVRMTGCPNGCARPYMGDVGLVGRSAGLYDLFLGGDWANTRLNAQFATGVKFDEIVPTLRPLLERWNAERSAGETFGDWVHRIGFDALRRSVETVAC